MMTEHEFNRLATESTKTSKTDWNGIAKIVKSKKGIHSFEELVALIGNLLTCKKGQLKNALRGKVKAGLVLAQAVDLRYKGSEMFIRVK